MTVTHVIWFVTYVTVTYDIILNPNSKFKNKKINRKENRNKKENKKKLSSPLSALTLEYKRDSSIIWRKNEYRS